MVAKIDRFFTSLTNGRAKIVLCFILYFSFVLTCADLNLPNFMQLIILVVQYSITAVFVLVYLMLFVDKASSKKIHYAKYIWNEVKKLAIEIPVFFIYLFVTSNLLSCFISGSPENQVRVVNEFYAMPISSFILVVITGPIMEEIIFRYLPYQFIANKKMYVIISAVVFASMHVVNDPNAFYYVWSYMFNALYFGYRYYKTKDLVVTISLHSFNNLLSVLSLLSSLF